MSILGIDIGGTKTIVALADSNGQITARRRFDTPRNLGPEPVIKRIIDAGRELLAEASEANIEGIGIACGGPLDPEEGRLIVVPNIPGWKDLPIARIFSEEFRAPVWLDNDATAAGFAEAVFGAGAGVSNLAYFTISTGIGGAIIIGGKPYRGGGNAAEFGHQKILPDGPACTCGDRGCLEALASGTSIAREAASSLKDVASSKNRTESTDLNSEWTAGLFMGQMRSAGSMCAYLSTTGDVTVVLAQSPVRPSLSLLESGLHTPVPGILPEALRYDSYVRQYATRDTRHTNSGHLSLCLPKDPYYYQ